MATGSWVGLGIDHQHVRTRSIRDPHLVAVKHPAIALFNRFQFHGYNI